MSSHKLSLPAAIIINLNIMIGAGIFINTIPLAQYAGKYSPLIYLFVGILMLPLVWGIAKLLKIYPGGSFYTFGTKSMSPTVGFFSAWSYFTCKLASSMLMIHFFSQIVSALIPIIARINIFLLDLIILSIFTLLNMLNMKAGSKIQYTFMVLKIIPIAFVIFSGLFLLHGNQCCIPPLMWQQFILGIPFGIYAFTGFEASCSLSRHIKDPEKNAPRAIFISYGLVITILCLYQLLFFTAIGKTLMVASGIQAFPLLVAKLLGFTHLSYKLQAFMQLAIGCSALGGAYGIMYSNNWNLYALAEHGHIFFAKQFAKLNRFGIPVLGILTEMLLSVLYLFVSMGDKAPLQQLAALGSTTAYTASIIALFVVTIRLLTNPGHLILPLLGLMNCFILLGFCIYGLITKGFYPFLVYLIILLFGLLMFYKTKSRQETILKQ